MSRSTARLRVLALLEAVVEADGPLLGFAARPDWRALAAGGHGSRPSFGNRSVLHAFRVLLAGPAASAGTRLAEMRDAELDREYNRLRELSRSGRKLRRRFRTAEPAHESRPAGVSDTRNRCCLVLAIVVLVVALFRGVH